MSIPNGKTEPADTDSEATIRKSLIANGLHIGIARLVRAFAPIFLTPLFLLAWGTSGYGEWLILIALPASLLLFQDGGVSSAIANGMGSLDSKQSKEAARLQSVAFMASVFACGIILIISVFVFVFVVCNMELQTLSLQEKATVFSLQTIVILWGLLGNSLVGTFRFSRRESRFYQIISNFGIIEVACIACALYLKASPVVVSLISFFVKAVQFACILRNSKYILGSLACLLRVPAWAEFKPYVKASFGFALLPAVVAIQNQGMVFLIYAIASPAAVTFYHVTRTYSNTIPLFTGIAYSSALPELPRLWSHGDLLRIRKIVKAISSLTVAASVFMGAGLILAGPIVFQFWTRSKIEFDFSLGGLLIGIAIVTSLLNCSTALPRATNTIYKLSVIFLIANVAFIGLAWLLQDNLNVYRLCLMLLVAEFASLVVTAFLLIKLLRRESHYSRVAVVKLASRGE